MIEEVKSNSKLCITLALLLLGCFFIAVDSITGCYTLWGWLGVILVCLSFIPLTINDSEDRKKEREKYETNR